MQNNCDSKLICGGVSALLSRLVIFKDALLGDDKPLKPLLSLTYALEAGDFSLATALYHEVAKRLISYPCFHSTGSLMMDFILNELFLSSNAFALMASRGEKIAPLYNAMKVELSLLNEIGAIDSASVRQMMADRLYDLRTRPRQTRDAAAVLSNAAWTGATTRPVTKAPDELPKTIHYPKTLEEETWVCWEYEKYDSQLEGLEPLYEIYMRFLNASSWKALTDELWNFHALYGSGQFIWSRAFTIDAEGIAPAHTPKVIQHTFKLHESAQNTLMGLAIRFMRGEESLCDGAAPFSALITGGDGVGKTSLVCSLADELPAAKLVMTRARFSSSIMRTIKLLAGQPHKFILFIDDVAINSPQFERLKNDIELMGLPQNVMLIVAATSGTCDMFAIHVRLEYPQLKQFIELVMAMLDEHGLDIDYDIVQNACIDYKVDAGEELSMHAAQTIFDGLVRGE